MAQRIGQILVDMGVLEDWQVQRIVDHQQLSRQRFGQIAVAWGWATPKDVWQAWAHQLSADNRLVELDDLGVDTAATEKVPPAMARHYQAVAIRTWGDNLVLAVPENLAELARKELPMLLGGNLYFCLADAQQVQMALERAYAEIVS